ncbi:hypothetical protein LCGC14_2036460 [marine sediment metagenome]|uniref:Uncharacterized protein n=1 Tax=marine sediment metagenome TaxID=412755 RepID=A0A0F9FFT5_9ZZZZ
MSYGINEPEAPATKKQTFKIFTLGGGDVREQNLTRKEASDKIQEMLAVNGKAVDGGPAMDFETLWEEAKADGYVAGTDAIPTPMIVEGYEHEPVMGGACGFAWVNFSMKKGLGRKFGKWLIDNDHARKDDYYGGCTIWIGEHGQSMARKEAHAHAMAQTLQRAGIEDAHGMSRMD